MPAQLPAWIDPDTQTVYVLRHDRDDTVAFTAITNERHTTVSTLPDTVVALSATPAPRPGVRHALLFLDDIAENEPRWHTGTLLDNGRWTVDGSERWTYANDELLIGTPVTEPHPEGGAALRPKVRMLEMASLDYVRRGWILTFNQPISDAAAGALTFRAERGQVHLGDYVEVVDPKGIRIGELSGATLHRPPFCPSYVECSITLR